MAGSIKHAKTNNAVDDGVSEVQPSHWNAEHTFSLSSADISDGLTAAQVVDLTDGGTTILHTHAGIGETVGAVPVGGIIMWSGTIATIPVPTWQLCDGTANAPGPDLRDKFIVGATADNAGAAKTNIEGSLKISGGTSAVQASAHANLSHANGAVGDHTGLTHGLTIANHPDLTHAALSHPAITIVHADHSVASASHTHAAITVSHADHSVAGITHADHSVAGITHADLSVAGITHADHSVVGITHADHSVASFSGTNAAIAGALSFATSTNRSGITGIASVSHTHAATTLTHVSHPATTLTHVSHPAVTQTIVSHPATTLTHVSHPATTLTHADHSLASISGVQAAVTLSHADHSFASLSHQDIGSHLGSTYGVHTVTAPAAHGTAGTVTHSFTQPDAHTISAHDSLVSLPNYFALAFIQRMI